MRLPALLLALLLPLPALADDRTPAACGARNEGQAACIADRQCLCRHEPGGILTGRPAGFRWDCGVLRPPCGAAPAGPTVPPDPFLFPNAPPGDFLGPGRPWR